MPEAGSEFSGERRAAGTMRAQPRAVVGFLVLTVGVYGFLVAIDRIPTAPWIAHATGGLLGGSATTALLVMAVRHATRAVRGDRGWTRLDAALTAIVAVALAAGCILLTVAVVQRPYDPGYCDRHPAEWLCAPGGD